VTVPKGRKPINTAQMAQDHPESVLVGAMGNPGGVSGFIESMEATAQVDACHSDTLPNQGSNDPAFAKMGIVFGDVVEGDSLFRHCTMPVGWKKVPTSHSMHNNVVDNKGRIRAKYFYKGAFYDRSAHIHACRRFGLIETSEEQERGEYDTEIRHSFVQIIDNGNLDENGKSTVAFETQHIEYKRLDDQLPKG